MHPEEKLVLRAFKKNVVDVVDHIVELSQGERHYVKTLDDWRVVEEVCNFFANQWPHEFKDFKEAIPQIRHSKRSGARSQSGDMVHLASVPPRLMRLIKVIFPEQQWDKQFITKLVRNFPLMKVAGEQNLS